MTNFLPWLTLCRNIASDGFLTFHTHLKNETFKGMMTGDMEKVCSQ